MRRYIAIVLFTALIISSIPFDSLSAVTRTDTVTREKTLPFSTTSSSASTYVDLSTSGLSNVQVVDSFVDNGRITSTTIYSNEVKVNLNDGTYSSQPKTVTKTDTLDIPYQMEDDGAVHTITKTAKGPVTSIVDCTGDFRSAAYSGNQLIISVDTSKGISDFDYTKKVTATAEITADTGSRKRNIDVTEDMPYDIIGGSVRTVSASCSNINMQLNNVSYGVSGSSLTAYFQGGTPTANEITRPLSHIYYVIDRHRDGHFSPYAPGSNYWAPNSYSFGYDTRGYYMRPENRLKSVVDKLSDWTDYMGYTLNGKRYTYIYSSSRGKPQNSPFTAGDYVSFQPFSQQFYKVDAKEEFYNTNIAKVSMNGNTITYEMEGRLAYTDDGDPAKAWEIQDAFYNPLTRQSETYVYHFKFHYGPKKHLYGGYFTYPYKCNVEYQHYKPVKKYAGTVTYSYQDIVDEPGYTYNGWVKVRYTEQATVLDCPPTAPINVAYNPNSTAVTWLPSTDDYTPQHLLVYDVQVRKTPTGIWQNIGRTGEGVTTMPYASHASGYKYRVRAVDGVGQPSDWSYSTEGKLTLTAEINPDPVPAGDKIVIDANVKASGPIQSVRAVCPALGIDTTLSESAVISPDNLELGYANRYTNSISGYTQFQLFYSYPYSRNYTDNGAGEKDFYERGWYDDIIIQDGRNISGANIYRFDKDCNRTLGYPFTPSGTVIIPGSNYGTIVSDPDVYDSDGKVRRTSWDYILNIDVWKNGVRYTVPFIHVSRLVNRDIKIYKFDSTYGHELHRSFNPADFPFPTHYDPTYGGTYTLKPDPAVYFNQDPICFVNENAPIAVTWSTAYDSLEGKDMTTFKLYNEGTQIYSFKRDTAAIERQMIGFTSYIYDVKKWSYRWSHRRGSSFWEEFWRLEIDRARGFPANNITYQYYYHNQAPKGAYVNELAWVPPETYAFHNAQERYMYRIGFVQEALSEDDIYRYLQQVRNTRLEVGNLPLLPDFVPSETVFTRPDVTVAATARSGSYILDVTATLTDGTSQTVEVPLTVATPINPLGNIPASMGPGSTYQVTATSSKYVNDMKLIVFGQPFTMAYNGLDASGKKKWLYNLTVPVGTSFGKYNQSTGQFRYGEFKAALPSGETASDFKSFEVVLAAAVAGDDIKAAPGETVEIIAATSGYCTSASVDMPTGTITLVSDRPVSEYENTWRANYTVTASQAVGTYNITYRGTNAYMTATHPARLIVDVYLNPVGDIPDSIETRTEFKMTCRTSLHAVGVTAVLSPSPGVAQYTLNLVSQDGTYKYWESNNIQYPEMSAGGSAGRTVTATFTARAANGNTETCTDTGHLWEKIEITAYELRESFYKDNDINLPIVETLCRSQSTHFVSEGFVLAGRMMGIKVVTGGYVDRIEMDFEGPYINYEEDKSIKTLDKLTKRFEWDEPIERGIEPDFSSVEDLENHYALPRSFDKRAAPIADYNNVYATYYLIPYGTKQSLHSWYTLREESGSAFNINKNRLLDRIKDPFILKLKVYSGLRYIEKDIYLDVFERWDTLFNRDLRPYIHNPENHDPVDRYYWETTDYTEY